MGKLYDLERRIVKLEKYCEVLDFLKKSYESYKEEEKTLSKKPIASNVEKSPDSKDSKESKKSK